MISAVFDIEIHHLSTWNRVETIRKGFYIHTIRAKKKLTVSALLGSQTLSSYNDVFSDRLIAIPCYLVTIVISAVFFVTVLAYSRSLGRSVF